MNHVSEMTYKWQLFLFCLDAMLLFVRLFVRLFVWLYECLKVCLSVRLLVLLYIIILLTLSTCLLRGVDAGGAHRGGVGEGVGSSESLISAPWCKVDKYNALTASPPPPVNLAPSTFSSLEILPALPLVMLIYLSIYLFSLPSSFLYFFLSLFIDLRLCEEPLFPFRRMC